jgi:hypothetical protein
MIQLRGGTSVCAKCISIREAELNRIESQIHVYTTTKPPRNIWDNLGTGIILLSIFLCIYGLLYIHFLALVGFGVAGLWLYGLTSKQSEKANEPFKQSMRTKTSQLGLERDKITTQLNSIYEVYKSRPPDWDSRRNQVIARDKGLCQKCGRRMYGSKLPFHVHHIIPTSKEEANHALSNLTLLCEICHSKNEEHGHQLVKGQRKKRLESKRRYRRYNRKVT